QGHVQVDRELGQQRRLRRGLECLQSVQYFAGKTATADAAIRQGQVQLESGDAQAAGRCAQDHVHQPVVIVGSTAIDVSGRHEERGGHPELAQYRVRNMVVV